MIRKSPKMRFKYKSNNEKEEIKDIKFTFEDHKGK
jgi:hypothetical protein